MVAKNLVDNLDNSKLVVVACENPKVLGEHDPGGFNGDILMYFASGGQCLLAAKGQEFEDQNKIVKEVFKRKGVSIPQQPTVFATVQVQLEHVGNVTEGPPLLPRDSRADTCEKVSD